MRIAVHRSVALPPTLVVGCVLSLLLGAALASSALAAPGDEVWAKTWKPAGAGVAYAPIVAVAPTGDVFVLGSTLREGKGDLDLFVARYTAGGTRKWVRYWDSAGHAFETPAAVVADARGDVVFCGSTSGAGGKGDWVVGKYARSGRLLWDKVGGGAGDDVAYDVAVDGARNVYTTSMSSGAAMGYWCETVKHSPGGKKLWTRRHLSMFGSFGKANVWYGGSLYVAAQDSLGDDAGVVTVIKYSPAGDEKWISWWREADHVDQVKDIAASKYGVVVTGHTSDFRGIVARFTHAGTQTLAKAWSVTPGAFTATKSCAIDDSGACYVAGNVAFTAGGTPEFLVARFPDGGVRSDIIRLAGDVSQPAGAADVAVTGSGRVYATGSRTLVPGGSAMLTAGWTGVAPWSTPWTSTLGVTSYGTSVAVASGAVYAAGATSGSRIVLAKYVR
jgi:hypothetical protein